MITTHKWCPSCSVNKNIKEFSKDKNTSTGFDSYCKTCRSNKNKNKRLAIKVEDYIGKLIPNTSITILSIVSKKTISKTGRKYSHISVLYRCECGYEGECWKNDIQKGYTTSCGRVECRYSKAGKMVWEAKNKFVGEANAIHNNFYDYSMVEYVNAMTKVKIICPKHGKFSQSPDKHLNGSGCRRCSKIVSKGETQWLDSLGLPNDPQHRQVSIQIGKRKFVVDGYDPQTNTVYEYHGDFWHGNPKLYDPTKINPRSKKTFGELFLKTTQRSQKIRSEGYNLISIWANEWEERNKLLLTGSQS